VFSQTCLSFSFSVAREQTPVRVQSLSRRACSFEQLRTSQSARLASKDKRRRKRDEEQIRQPEVPELLRLLSSLSSLSFLFSLSLSLSRPQKVTEATRRLGSMRAQMGLCLMKFPATFEASRTNGRYTASSTRQEIGGNCVPRNLWDSYLTTAILSFPFFRLRLIIKCTRVAIARSYNRTRQKDSHVQRSSLNFTVKKFCEVKWYYRFL